MYHEDFVDILPKILNQTGILNIGGKARSVYSFAKLSNKKVKKLKATKKDKLPLNQTMDLTKLNKIIGKK